jgi:hypothetical protein
MVHLYMHVVHKNVKKITVCTLTCVNIQVIVVDWLET